MNLIGQNKIREKLNKLTIDNCPRTLLLVGESGCGKHHVSSIISTILGFDIRDITDTISLDTINDVYVQPNPYVYLIDGNKITEKQENVILKFLEEPLKNSFIILLADNKSVLLPTIINRCQVWEFEPYSIEDLLQFLSLREFHNQEEDKLICRLAKTPGRVKYILSDNHLNQMLTLSETMFKKIKVSAFSNILNISNRIAFKDEQDKFDFDLFCNVLVYTIKNIVDTESDVYYNNLYTITNQFINNCRIPHINKQLLFEHYLYELKMCV